MHNLHFVVIRSSSGERACNQVESEIMDWGTENNWRTICGAVSEADEVYDAGDGRYRPIESDLSTIQKINEAVNHWVKDCWYSRTAKEKFEKGETDLNQWGADELWSLSKYAKHLSESHPYKNREFDILKNDIYYPYQYDECGVTNMVYSRSEDDEEAITKPKDKIWIVFVDMHS